MGMVSGQPWPGCQLALQAEQNSASQAWHCTSCGVCSPVSWSWHTAWQVDAGHQVRQGSRSTSGTGNKNGQVKLCRTKDLAGLRTDGHGLRVFKGEKEIKVRHNIPFTIRDPSGSSSSSPRATPHFPLHSRGGQQIPNYSQSPRGSGAPTSWKPRGPGTITSCSLPACPGT